MSKRGMHFGETSGAFRGPICQRMVPRQSLHKLAEQVKKHHDDQVQSFGIAFALEAETDDETAWLKNTAAKSLFDWVSANRASFMQESQKKIAAFVETMGGKVPVQHREDVTHMVSLANAAIVHAVERALVHGSPAQSLFNADIMNRRNTDVSSKQPADGVDDRGTPESDPFWRRDSAMGSDIHVPIGQDVATYLGQVSNDAFKWTVCQRKMGLFQLASAADGGDFES